MGVTVGTSVRVGVLVAEGGTVTVLSTIFVGDVAVNEGAISAAVPQAENENIKTMNTNKCLCIAFPFYSENKKRQFITAS